MVKPSIMRLIIVIITRLTQYADLHREANPLSVRPVHREADSLSIRSEAGLPWLCHAATAPPPGDDVSELSPLPLAVPPSIPPEPLPAVLVYADDIAVFLPLASPPAPPLGPCLQVPSWSSAWLIFSTPNSRCPHLFLQNPYPQSSCRPMIWTCFLRWLPLPSPPSG